MAYAAYTNESLRLSADRGWRAQLKQRIADYRLYLRTLEELNALNERDLSDLGISRFEVKRIARESVYGAR
jgi:uncharacterized protein YjiS (DUF1127 family)